MKPRGFIAIPIVLLILGVLAVGTVVIVIVTHRSPAPVQNQNTVGVANANSSGNTNAVPNTNITINTNTSSNTNTAADLTAGWRTYSNSVAHFTMKYDPGWTTQGTENLQTNFGPNSTSLMFTSVAVTKDTISQNGDYACVQTQIGSGASDYQLSGGSVVATLSDGLKLYQEKKTYQGKEYPQLTITDSNMRSVVKSSDGTNVLTIGLFDCAEGDVGSAKLSYQQMLDSQLYQTTLNTLKTFAFTDPTAGWKTYTNTAFKYTFDYPKDWVLGDSPTSSIPNPSTNDIAFDGLGYESFRFGVRVVPLSGCSTLRACTEANRLTFGTGEQTTGLSETMVTTLAVLTETITRQTMGDWKYYVNYMMKNGNLYRTFTITKVTDDGATKPTFDQILSTFRFTQ